MRSKLMVAFSALVLAALNFGIYEKEQIIEHGEIMLLELAPVDPRSLIQGDYMRLRYDLSSKVPVGDLDDHQKRGFLVIGPDEKNVAQFVRFYRKEKLSENEKLLHFHKQYSRISIVPDSFFFQEGHAKYYEDAKYGVFKFDDSSNSLLVGLADKEMKEIIVPVN